MINQSKITSEWISKVSEENNNADKILIEKVIRALLLVEGLVKQKIEFTFKGGTALMLLFDSPKRLSIDIDIIMPKEYDELDSSLENLVKEQGFTRKELQERISTPRLRKSHYKFFYTPLYKTSSEEEYVLLDILFEKNNYQNIIQRPIDSKFVQITDNPLLVNVPSSEDILGDKLTAFAPYTTGIPYSKSGQSMSMEIIKQLYDIGNLFNKAKNLEVIKSTFSSFANTELIYRGKEELKVENVTDDIFETALVIASRGTIDEKKDFEQLQSGIRRVKSFIFSENFNIDKAIIAASKAAYLAMLIKYNSDTIEKYSDPLEISDWLLKNPPINKLNKLKKSNPEAFFYWYKAIEIIEKNK